MLAINTRCLLIFILLFFADRIYRTAGIFFALACLRSRELRPGGIKGRKPHPLPERGSKLLIIKEGVIFHPLQRGLFFLGFTMKPRK